MTELQKEILYIYKEIAVICKNNDIKFFSIGGTCLGAVRHKGFIPWDDDLDIAVPIEQFDFLKECLKKQLPENLYLYDCNDIKHYRYIFIKVCDRNTAFIEESEKNYPDAYKGVFVDIMPISGIPEVKADRLKFCKKVNLFDKLNFIYRYPFSEMETWKKRIIWIILKVIYPNKRYDLYSTKWMKLLNEYPLSTSNISGYVWSSDIDRLSFPIDCITETVDLPFEDATVPCPYDWDAFLSVLFGDYMTLPPVEKRQEHHPYIVNLNKSYLEYVEEK